MEEVSGMRRAAHLALSVAIPLGFPAQESIGQDYLAPSVMITEIMVNPDGIPDADGEWFEVYNYSSVDSYDVDGWVFRDDGLDAFVVSGSLVLQPCSYLLFAASDDPAVNDGLPAVDYVYGYGGFTLGNFGDEIVIEAGGVEVDRVMYVSGAATAGRSLACMFADPVANDDPANWYSSSTPYGDFNSGTPNAPNEVFDGCVATSVPAPGATEWFLGMPAPNPTSSPVRMALNVSASGPVRVTVHDVSGRTIRVLVDRAMMAGTHVLSWAGTGPAGHLVPAGVYWVRAESVGKVQVRQLTMVR